MTGQASFATLEQTVGPSHTALLVIDVQNDLCHDNCRTMLPRLGALIGAARGTGVFLVYVQNSNLPDGSSVSPSEIARRRILGIRNDVTIDGTPGQEFVAAVAPLSADPIVRKHRMNSFLGTDLDMVLRWRGIKTVVCTGVSTHGCIMNTSCAAVGNDYYTVVAEDCVASAETSAHETALAALRNGIHYVVPSRALMAAWPSALRA